MNSFHACKMLYKGPLGNVLRHRDPPEGGGSQSTWGACSRQKEREREDVGVRRETQGERPTGQRPRTPALPLGQSGGPGRRRKDKPSLGSRPRRAGTQSDSPTPSPLTLKLTVVFSWRGAGKLLQSSRCGRGSDEQLGDQI